MSGSGHPLEVAHSRCQTPAGTSITAFLRSVLIALMAGGLLTLAAVIPPAWPLGLIGAGCFVVSIRAVPSGRRGLRALELVGVGGVAGVVAYGSIAVAGPASGELPWVLSGVAVMVAIGLAATQDVDGYGGVIRPALAAVIAGWIRQLVLSGRSPVEVMALGQSQSPLLGAAALGGPLVVTALVVAIGAAAADSFATLEGLRQSQERGKGKLSWSIPLLVVVGSAVVLAGTGWLDAAPSGATSFNPDALVAPARGQGAGVSLAEALRGYGTDLTVFTGERRSYEGLVQIRRAGRGVYAVTLGGDLADPWSRAAIDIGARVLAVEPGPDATMTGGQRLRISEARVEAVAAGRTVVLLSRSAPPVVIDGRGARWDGSVGLDGAQRAGTGQSAGPGQRSVGKDLFVRIGDSPLLLVSVLGLFFSGSRVRSSRRWQPGTVREPGAGREAGRALALLAAGFAVLTAAGSAVGLLITHGPLSGPIERFDNRVTNLVTTHHSDRLHTITQSLTVFAHPPLSILVAAGIGAVASRWRWSLRPLVAFLLATVGAELLTGVLKVIVARPPPGNGVAAVDRLSTSFPSGHSTEAAAIAVALVLVLDARPQVKRFIRCGLGSAAVMWAVLVAAARVYQVDHYVTDVCAGLVLGGGWAVVVAQATLLRGRKPL